jgi:hypothetical protein
MVNDKKHVGPTAMLKALQMKYESDIQAARATLMVYLTNPAGIGEHPQHLEEMDKLLQSMGAASDKLGMLEKYFNGGPLDELAAGSPSEHHYTNGL